MSLFRSDHTSSCGVVVYVAADHAGFDLKTTIASYLRQELGCEVVDCGAAEMIPGDDYPEFIAKAAKAVAEDPANRVGIVFGGSGQGEAMVANRFKGVRAALYYGSSGSTQVDATGANMDIVVSSRVHNNANMLSLGARFLNVEEAKEVVKKWIMTKYPKEERHERRIQAIDMVT